MLNVYEELSDESKRKILAELVTGPKNVSQVVEATGLKQPNVSNHLARMKKKDVVRASKVGREVFYALSTAQVERIVRTLFAASDDVDTIEDLEEVAKQYAKAAIQGDEAACVEIVDGLFRMLTSLVDIYEKVLTPALRLVGTWQSVQAIDEAQEHLASGITERVMARAAQVYGPIKHRGGRAVLGCAPDCWHVIGLRMISDYLRLCGWTVFFLGANVPTQSFVAAVKDLKPQLALISCSCSNSVESTLALIHEISECTPNRKSFQIGVGGLEIIKDPDQFLRAGADFKSDSLGDFARNILPKIEESLSL